MSEREGGTFEREVGREGEGHLRESEVLLLTYKQTTCFSPPQVCKSLGILEKEYFGLRFLDKNREYLWINLRNPLHEQLVPGNRLVMDMRVKYFIKPQKILQPVTRSVQVWGDFLLEWESGYPLLYPLLYESPRVLYTVGQCFG